MEMIRTDHEVAVSTMSGQLEKKIQLLVHIQWAKNYYLGYWGEAPLWKNSWQPGNYTCVACMWECWIVREYGWLTPHFFSFTVSSFLFLLV